MPILLTIWPYITPSPTAQAVTAASTVLFASFATSHTGPVAVIAVIETANY